MSMVTLFLPILNQIEFNLVLKNRYEKCHHDHIPLKITEIRIPFLRVYKFRTLQKLLRNLWKRRMLLPPLKLTAAKISTQRNLYSITRLKPLESLDTIVLQWSEGFQIVSSIGHA